MHPNRPYVGALFLANDSDDGLINKEILPEPIYP
jgi:hypothetical protein